MEPGPLTIGPFQVVPFRIGHVPDAMARLRPGWRIATTGDFSSTHPGGQVSDSRSRPMGAKASLLSVLLDLA